MTENKPGIISIQENDGVISHTRLTDFPIGLANYTSESILGGTGLTRLDTTPLKGEHPHIYVEMDDVAVSVLVNTETPTLPLANGILVFDASQTRANIAAEKKAQSKPTKINKPWRDINHDWSGRSIRSLSGYKGL
jgi:hypothetical protein